MGQSIFFQKVCAEHLTRGYFSIQKTLCLNGVVERMNICITEREVCLRLNDELFKGF